MERDDPNDALSKTERVDPNESLDHTLHPEPMRAHDLMEAVEPMLNQSRTEQELDNRNRPNRLKELP
jgi:hypothetical protein